MKKKYIFQVFANSLRSVWNKHGQQNAFILYVRFCPNAKNPKKSRKKYTINALLIFLTASTFNPFDRKKNLVALT